LGRSTCDGRRHPFRRLKEHALCEIHFDRNTAAITAAGTDQIHEQHYLIELMMPTALHASVEKTIA
jgi:hypothetical protein